MPAEHSGAVARFEWLPLHQSAKLPANALAVGERAEMDEKGLVFSAHSHPAFRGIYIARQEF